jgi:hypothetical protein
MKRSLVLVPMMIAGIIFLSQCLNKNAKAPVQKASVTAGLITHKEAVDSLLADSTAPLKPLIFKIFDNNAKQAALRNMNLDSLFINDYPDNGFYGDNRYRIEFVFNEAKRDDADPSVYHIKGKNRHKKTITNFEGTVRITELRSFTDPNMESDHLANSYIKNLYTAKGIFEFKEDTAMINTSGLFKGTLQMEFAEYTEFKPQLWFYSAGMYATDGRGTPGYRLDGTWTSFKNPNMVKPVIWARDLFSFANDILKDFSMGERDVEISPQYRDLGWADFWENEEWWHESPKELK